MPDIFFFLLFGLGHAFPAGGGVEVDVEIALFSGAYIQSAVMEASSEKQKLHQSASFMDR